MSELLRKTQEAFEKGKVSVADIPDLMNVRNLDDDTKMFLESKLPATEEAIPALGDFGGVPVSGDFGGAPVFGDFGGLPVDNSPYIPEPAQQSYILKGDPQFGEIFDEREKELEQTIKFARGTTRRRIS